LKEDGVRRDHNTGTIGPIRFAGKVSINPALFDFTDVRAKSDRNAIELFGGDDGGSIQDNKLEPEDEHGFERNSLFNIISV
jgi:hypothetical protein